jgi:hypothetical protein
LLTILVYVQPKADDTPVDVGQGDGAGGDVGGTRENTREDEAVIEAAATDVAEASRVSKISHQTEV